MSPFQSEAQRRWLWMTNPRLAKKWAHEYPGQHNLPYHKGDKMARHDGRAVRAVKAPEHRRGVMHHGHVTPSARAHFETLPGGGYPMPDKAHARNALSRVAAAVRRGNISEADAAKVRARALRMLGKSKTKGKSEERGEHDSPRTERKEGE